MASKQGFKHVGGVEYNKTLYDICVNNLGIEGISMDGIVNIGAQSFKEYFDYDIFYFNNPFGPTVMEEVATRIFNSHIDKECFLYYVNPIIMENNTAILNAGFKLVNQIKDKSESYFDVNVYTNIVDRNRKQS